MALLAAAMLLSSCTKEDEFYRSEYLSRVPTNVTLEDYDETSFIISWSYVEGATSYTVQLVDLEEIPTESTIYTTTNEAAHQFTCDENTAWYARVRANYPENNYSDWVYLTYDNSTERAILITGRGKVYFDPVLTLLDATSSTLTYYWGFTDDDASDINCAYELCLYSSEECDDESLVVGWTIPEDSGLFDSTAGCRFTFSGLDPSTTYYCVVKNTSYYDMAADIVDGTTSSSGPAVTATASGSATVGSVLVSEDFSKVYHGGDIAHLAAAYYITADYRSENLKAEGMDAENCTLTKFSANEFDVFDGGSVTAEYTEGTGLADWANVANVAGRSGYVKLGASGANASLWTPVLSALPAGASTVSVSFSAMNYSEHLDGSGADPGLIVVSAVEGAEISSKYVASGGTTLMESAEIDVTDTFGGFKTFSVEIQNVTPESRIVIGTVEKRVLLDNVVVTYLGPTSMTKLSTPQNVAFDQDAIYSSSLVLTWDEVDNAYSYTVRYWADGDEDNAKEVNVSTNSYNMTGLTANTKYYAQVKACAYTGYEEYDSDYSSAVSCSTNDAEEEVIPINVEIIEATSSTLTYEWAVDGDTNSADYTYNVELYNDYACTDLHVSWIVAPTYFTTYVRFTFSGLDPNTTYYARITRTDDTTYPTQSEPIESRTAGFNYTVSTNTTAEKGDVLVAEDFSGLIHGGDIARKSAAITAETSMRGSYEIATGENPTDKGSVCTWDTEFNVFNGGSVTTAYTEGTGLGDWAFESGSNTSTRPGYIKIGGASAFAHLYTPVLSTIPDGATADITVKFSVQTYNQTAVSASAVRVGVMDNVTIGSKNAASGGTETDFKTISIDTGDAFSDYTTTLTGVTNTSRVRIGSDITGSASYSRFLLDNVVVIVDDIVYAEQLGTPQNVAFAEPTEKGELTLSWDKVDNAASYEVEYWPTADASSTATVTAESNTATLTGLESSTEYSAHVKAVSGSTSYSDSDWSATVTATTITPVDLTLDDVTNLAASPSFSTITLTWDAVNDAAGYQVSYNGNTENVTDNSFTATGLALATEYSFSVIALSSVDSEYNSKNPTSISATTLYMKIVATTTSSIVAELEQEGSESQYTWTITDGTNSKTFTYDYSSASGYSDGLPIRYVFNFVGDEWPTAYLQAGTTYSITVKTGASDSSNEYSAAVTGQIATRNTPSSELFYEDFDKFMGSDAVDKATGVKTKSKISSDAGMSTQFTSFTYCYWSEGGGAMQSGSGTYGDPYRLEFFKDYSENNSWETGTISGSSATHNAFNGCFRLGGDNANQSYLATPVLSDCLTEATNVTVNFKTAVNVFWQTSTPGSPAVSFDGNWRRDAFNTCCIYVEHTDGTFEAIVGTDSALAVGVEGAEFEWKSQSVNIDGLLPTDRIVFATTNTSKSRYYLDEISVVKR